MLFSSICRTTSGNKSMNSRKLLVLTGILFEEKQLCIDQSALECTFSDLEKSCAKRKKGIKDGRRVESPLTTATLSVKIRESHHCIPRMWELVSTWAFLSAPQYPPPPAS